MMTPDQNLASGRPGEEVMCQDVHVVQGGVTHSKENGDFPFGKGQKRENPVFELSPPL